MKTRWEIEAEANDFRDRLLAEQKRAEADRPNTPPGWLLDKWAQDRLEGRRPR